MCNGFLILYHFDFENYIVNISSKKKMESTVEFKRDSKNVKRPLHLKNGVFLIYAPRNLTFCPKTDEIEQISDSTQRIWIRFGFADLLSLFIK